MRMMPRQWASAVSSQGAETAPEGQFAGYITRADTGPVMRRPSVRPATCRTFVHQDLEKNGFNWQTDTHSYDNLSC